ncbi:DUF1569 domain-containing protein [Aquiflexum sp.]|uniref:DUF1569 domain-containing protein n=1 Tax=Aquiflexum sp. TaxID=1872584 RepID=UPI0035931131
MNKTILNPIAVEEVIERAKRLNPQTTPHWGKMTVSEMLSHCNMAHQSILKAPMATAGPTLRQRVFKFWFFHLRKEFPKLARGPKRFDMKGKVDEKVFEEEKSKFIHIVAKFTNRETQMAGSHPVFGPLNHQYWGVFVWRHLDHHLRQFGV